MLRPCDRYVTDWHTTASPTASHSQHLTTTTATATTTLLLLLSHAARYSSEVSRVASSCYVTFRLKFTPRTTTTPVNPFAPSSVCVRPGKTSTCEEYHARGLSIRQGRRIKISANNNLFTDAVQCPPRVSSIPRKTFLTVSTIDNATDAAGCHGGPKKFQIGALKDTPVSASGIDMEIKGVGWGSRATERDRMERERAKEERRRCREGRERER